VAWAAERRGGGGKGSRAPICGRKITFMDLNKNDYQSEHKSA
jgi:hypothetical protein